MTSRRLKVGWGLGCLLFCFGGCAGSAASETGDGHGTPNQNSAQSIPFVSDGCEQYGLKFDPTIASSDCTQLCDCDISTLGMYTPRGCLVAGDCEAICRPDNLERTETCLLNGCAVDGDCSSGRCFVPPGRQEGLCGTVDSDCLDDHDCSAPKVCVAVDSQGTRRCIAPDRETPCNSDQHCPGAHCALPHDRFVGVCSRSKLHDRCFSAEGCEAPLFCGASVCSDGSHGTTCDADSQCQSGYCADETCQDGRDNDYCSRDSQCQSGICIYDVRCASGEVDAGCESDADCHSGICAQNGGTGDSACTTGEPGAKCFDAGDCASGNCNRDLPSPREDHFGRCQ